MQGFFPGEPQWQIYVSISPMEHGAQLSNRLVTVVLINRSEHVVQWHVDCHGLARDSNVIIVVSLGVAFQLLSFETFFDLIGVYAKKFI